MSAAQRFQDDTWQKAKDAAESISACWCDECVNRVARQVAQLVQDERERCALIAKSHGVLVPVSGVEQWMHVGNSVALAISEEILNSSALAPNLPADEKAVPPFNKRGTASLSSEDGGDEE